MANIAYMRVSSNSQCLDRQTDALAKFSIEKTFVEKISAKDTNRPELKKMLDFSRKGDSIVVLSFDRLARSLSDLLRIVEILKNKDVNLISVKEAIDTNTPTGKLQMSLMGAISEFERELIAERRISGVQAAKARGKKFGRPRVTKPKEFTEQIELWKHGKQNATETFKKLGLSKTVFYELLKKENKKTDMETISVLTK